MKILLWADVPGWAFEMTADKIIENLPEMDIRKKISPTLNPEKFQTYDKIHAFNWLYGQQFAGKRGVSAGVCQHNWEIKWQGAAGRSIPKFEKMVGISKVIAEKIRRMNPNTTYIPNAVDENQFQPNERRGPVTVGWCAQKTRGGFGELKGAEGQPKWDIKGYEIILKPLIKRLQGKVKFDIHTNNHENAVPHNEMQNWYAGIDIHICTSLYEGGPFPVLEASACGKPVVSTNVGIVPELLKHGHNGYLINTPKNRADLNRVINEFEKYILFLSAEKALRKRMGECNREEIERNWTWKRIVPKWRQFFEED